MHTYFLFLNYNYIIHASVHCTPTGNTTELKTLENLEETVSHIPLLIDLLRGRDGRDGLPGRDGEKGAQGEQGPAGPQGDQGLPGPRSAGVTYIRWGKSSCPTTPGTQLVYAGRAGGSEHMNQGGGAEKICVPLDPDYIDAPRSTSATFFSTLHGVEYQSLNGPLHNLFDHNAPCAVCYAFTRAAMIMVPAKTQCPSSWTREYYGYLMTEREHRNHHRSSFDYVDVNPDVVPGAGVNTEGALFQYVIASCSTGIQCPPYVANKVMSCAVCTK